MLGQKTKLIRKLNDELETLRNLRNKAESSSRKAWEFQKEAAERLSRNKEVIAGYEGQVEAYAEDLARESNINNALAEQNRDLVRQLELYKAVLAQLSIPIKLPARKQ
jgi:chromosome segregation ATPase